MNDTDDTKPRTKPLTKPGDLPLTDIGGGPIRRPQHTLESEKEEGGPKGPEPTRFNDWEKNGRCSDF